MSDGVKLNGGILRQKWSCFADLKGIPKDERLTLSEGWLTVLKKQCGLHSYKTHGEAGSASIEEVKTEWEHDVSSADIYDINILEAMWMANIAWNEVNTTTICNCWCKSSILPESLFNPASTTSTVPSVSVSSLLNNDPVDTAIAAAEKELANSLSHLEQLSVLQPSNRMALHELLNLVNKNGMHNASGIMEHVESEETREMNGGDVEDLNALFTDAELKPACCEALKAALTLQAYMADLNEPFACELEDILAKFSHQTCLDEFKSLCPTAITDYLPQLASNA
ncbi:hypothetical protein C0995_004294 [Termitomyces sp. Mi166|nr:hypothetical protein C0995_004294 [Termitomyces sp. Mi166\